MVLPLLGAIGSIAGSFIGSNSAKKAAQAQADATRYAADIQRQNFQDTQATLRPQIEAGDTAREYQLGLMGLPGGVNRQSALDAFQTSPGYEFAYDQGLQAVDRSAAARGMSQSGAQLKALSQFGQGMANQEYGNYYNRLAGLSGSGQAATGQQVNAGQSTANNLANLAVQGGNDRASSYVNQGNAITGGLQGIYNAYANTYRPQQQQNNTVPWRNPDTGVWANFN